jgi:archaeosine synthase
MTDYFEVHARDGVARAGELRLDPPLATPAAVDDRVVDAGSLWPAERDAPEGDAGALTVLPHRALPAGTPAEVAAAFAVDPADVDFPSAAVVSAETARDHGADAYVLSEAQGVVGHAEAFLDAGVAVREATPPDTALYLAGVATPRNVATLAYAGVDLVDTTRARVEGTRGRYLTTDAALFLEDLDELPCPCPACAVDRDAFDRAACADHNERVLRGELGRVRRRVADGRLRDYVEGQARHANWCTAVLRRLDDRYSFAEPRTPVVDDASMQAATEDGLRRVEIQRFADRVTTRYRNRFGDRPLVLVPCSATKPYGESPSHAQFREAIGYRGHLVSMTSPIGVVPQELELTYPAQHYDAVVTGRWSANEREFVTEVLRRYLRRTDYPRVVAHVPDEGYRDVVAEATAGLDLPVEYTVADHPTTDESLANLRAALAGESTYRKREREHNTVRAIADYMLGPAAGDDLFESFRTTSRHPKLQVRAPPDHEDGGGDEGGAQWAAMVPNYGVLAFTLAGARRWVESDAPTKRVDIDGFVPHGSVLAPGVVDATDAIRPGDEVVVEGPRAFAVGRAEMSGPEMRASTRGVAVDVRHVEEL